MTGIDGCMARPFWDVQLRQRYFKIAKEKPSSWQLPILIDVTGVVPGRVSTFFKHFGFGFVIVPAGVFNYSYAQPRVSSSSYRCLAEFSFLVSTYSWTCRWNVVSQRTRDRRWSYSCQFLFLQPYQYLTSQRLRLSKTPCTCRSNDFIRVDTFRYFLARPIERDVYTNIVDDYLLTRE